MNAMLAPEDADLKRRIVEFMRGASTEISPHDAGLIPALANRLPSGTVVYVAHTPKATLDDVVRIALEVARTGLVASPHLVARRLASERVLRDALMELRDGGVEQILLVAGDLKVPHGSYSNALQVLECGATIDAGIRMVGIAGYPEGHNTIGPSALWQALRDKQAFAERTGVRMHIVTQFGFDPNAVCTWAAHLANQGITLPVHVGIAGPTSLPKLIRFAMHCGIGASLNTLVKNMSALSHLARPAVTPDAMLSGLVRGCVGRATHIAKPHFYGFGGSVATARWLRAVADGSFELEEGSSRFLLKG